MPRLLYLSLTFLVVLGVLPWFAGAADAPKVPPLNAKVLAYANKQFGKKVGNGECWTLANLALKSAGARQPGVKGYGLYVFGRKVALKDIVPGDILQFEKVRFEHDDGKSFYFQNLPHHTAIVSSVKGKQVTLIHQNENNVKKVTRLTINLAHQKGGTIAAFRPQPKK
jgi:hypothetical protein